MQTQFNRTLWIALLGTAAVWTCRGQTATSASAAAPPPAARKAPMSNEVSSALKAGISYQPPQPAEPAPEPREEDKPRNQIIHLPEHVVQAQRPAVFTERSLYTQNDLGQLAIQRYLHMQSSNRLGPKLIAMQMYRDDERLSNMADMNQKVELFRVSGDTAAAQQLQRDAAATYARRSEFSPPAAASKVDFTELPK